MQKTQTFIRRSIGNNSTGQDWDLNCRVDYEGHGLINAGKRWFFNFPTKRVALWWALPTWWDSWSNGVVAKMKWHLRGWGGVFERPTEERETRAKEIPISKSKGPYGEWMGARELEKETWRLEKAMQQPQRWKVSMLRGSAGRSQILYQHGLLQLKSQGAYARPSRLLGQSEEAPLRSCDLLPQAPFNSQS